MKNISFDNPYLLLLAIPLLLVVIIPYAIAIRKDNVSKSVVASLILHVVMVLCITLAAAGTTHTTVITQTNVYVVADVSYSTQSKLDEIDEHIRSVEKALPNNSQMGVVCFGADQVELVRMGGQIRSVKNAKVDVGATDIAAALNYTVNCFADDAIKRIVLITDGSDTSAVNNDGLLSAIENLYLKNIYIDAIYLNTNLAETESEVQISEVDFTPNIYKGHEAFANVLVQSNRDANAILNLYVEDGKNPISSKAVKLTKGYNIVDFALSAEEAGVFAYTVEVSSEGDVTKENNTYMFTQSVEDIIEVLLIGEKESDLKRLQDVYGTRANVYAPLVPDEKGKTKQVPFSIEDLCKYDEIVISDYDVRELQNRTSFVESLDQAVSLFGKSLITMGNTEIQNMTEEDVALSNLSNMLPVNYGNASKDKKLLALVFDFSRSMHHSYKQQLTNAKTAARHLVNLLNPEDRVLVIPFSGNINSEHVKAYDADNPELLTYINGLKVEMGENGTMIGSGLVEAYKQIKELTGYATKDLYLISDGITAATELSPGIKYEKEKGVFEYLTFTQLAEKIKKDGMVTSTIFVSPYGQEEQDNIPSDSDWNSGWQRLKEIAEAGGGKNYYIGGDDVDDILLNEVAEDLMETVVERVSEIKIERNQDSVLAGGLYSLPEVSTYVNSKAKGNATLVLTTEYEKPNGTSVDVPIYAYWNYGNGRVSSFTSALTGEWISAWEGDERAKTFFNNVFNTNIPKERHNTPYMLTLSSGGLETYIELVPAQLHYDATTEITVVAPDETTETVKLTFDSQKYTHTLQTTQLGRYELQITYRYEDWEYTSTTYFEIPYKAEYNRFTVKDIGSLTDVIRNRGTVYTDGNIEMNNDRSAVDTYQRDYTVPLLIAAVVLFVVDIVVRKMKLEDFKMLFKRKKKGGGK